MPRCSAWLLPQPLRQFTLRADRPFYGPYASCKSSSQIDQYQHIAVLVVQLLKIAIIVPNRIVVVPFHLVVFKEFRNPIDVGSKAMMGFRATNLIYDIIPY
jgi:hypothetical protein